MYQRMKDGLITYSNGRLWGAAGGQLEYVSQEIVLDPVLGQFVMLIKFTDHDHSFNNPEDAPDLVEGRYYVLEVPLAE